MEAAVRSVLGSVLNDEDLLEHLVGVLEDEPSEEESGETVKDFLLSASDVDESTASALSTALFAALRGADAPPPPPTGLEEGTAKLDVGTVKMGSELEEELAAKKLKKHTTLETFDIGKLKTLRAQRKVHTREAHKMEEAALRDAAIAHELKLAVERVSDDSDQGQDEESALGDMALDVHLRGFDLANKKGSGGDLLVGAAMTISAGRRYGLLGRNGCGKTTLLQYLASRPDAPREKKPAIPARMSLLLVKQEVVGSELCAVEIVVRSDTRREGLKAAIASLEAVAKPTPSALDALAKCYEKLARRDELRGAPGPRARQVLSGLGFTQEMMDRQTSELSGGWRMRCSIAAALFAAPSMLLLDEPTNHLDLEAARSRVGGSNFRRDPYWNYLTVMWLEKYLTTKYHGTLVMVSHDRAFLNAVVTDVVHLDHKKLKTYRGDVKSFEVVRLDDLARQAKARQVQEAKRDHMQKYIDDHSKAGENGPKAAAQRKSRMKKMSRLGVEANTNGKKYKLSYDGAAEETEEIEEDDPVELYFPDPGPFENRSIVKMQRASFSYKDQLAPMLLKDCDMSIDSNARIALLGRNGCGKSTLIKLLVGDLFPNRGGDVFIEPGAKIEYVAQHQLEQLDPFGTPLEALQERYPGDGSTSHEQVLRNHLAHFGLGGDTLPSQKIHTLSGGQKCRVCLAAAMYRRPHLLVLDEPTNHLDMETTDALILAIKNFKGGVLLVSHDEHLCSNVCSQLYVVQDAKLERLSGSFAQYKKDVLAGRR